jgi:hypothetical protein
MWRSTPGSSRSWTLGANLNLGADPATLREGVASTRVILFGSVLVVPTTCCGASIYLKMW